MINTWQQGQFIDDPRYNNLSDEDKQRAHQDELLKVRPSPKGNAICFCSNPDDAKWIAERLNLAANLERKYKIVERYADNGELSHYDVINPETGEIVYGSSANTSKVDISKCITGALPYKSRKFEDRNIYNKDELKHIATNYAIHSLHGYEWSFEHWFDRLHKDWRKIANRRE